MIRSMKDSRIKWIGEIPESWDVVAIQRNFDEIKEINENMQCVIPLQYKYGKIIRKQENNCSEQKSIYTKYLLVKANDIMINGLNLSFDFITQRVARVEEDGIITSTYIALRPKATVDSRYATFLFKSYDGCKALHSMGRGLRSILSFNEFKKYNMPYPPLAEQKKIVDFLDGKCAEIDELVQTEEKMIEELKAYKQSVITEAVTKGLDPSAPMKDSGIEWIGKIPECWEIMTLKSLFDFGKGLPITKEDLRVSGEKVISYGQIHAKFNISTRIVNDMYRFVDSVYVDSHSNSIVKVGDFIFADTSEDLSGVGDFVYINDNDVIFAGYHSIILKSRMTTSNKYLAYLFLSDCWRSQLRSRVSGIKVLRNKKNILSRVTVLFPSASEQQKIADYLDDKCAKIDEMIAIRNEQIDQLKEYKKSLIYEYVTGKKEVV